MSFLLSAQNTLRGPSLPRVLSTSCRNQIRVFLSNNAVTVNVNNPTIVGGPHCVVEEIATIANFAGLQPLVVHPEINEIEHQFKKLDITAARLFPLPNNVPPEWVQLVLKAVGDTSIIHFPGTGDENSVSPCVSEMFLNHFWTTAARSYQDKNYVPQRLVCVLDPETARLKFVSEALQPQLPLPYPISGCVVSGVQLENLTHFREKQMWQGSVQELAATAFGAAFMQTGELT